MHFTIRGVQKVTVNKSFESVDLNIRTKEGGTEFTLFPHEEIETPETLFNNLSEEFEQRRGSSVDNRVSLLEVTDISVGKLSANPGKVIRFKAEGVNATIFLFDN